MVKSEEQHKQFVCVLGFTVRVPNRPSRHSIAESAKQIQEVKLGKATVHHRRVVTGPTPPWYRERRDSYSRMFATCEAGNMTSSSATRTAVTTLLPAVVVLPVALATSHHGPRVAGPPADYSEEHHPPN